MPISKSVMDCYRLREGGERATICLKGYHLIQEDRHGVELLLNSGYGTFSYHWSHCGEEYRKFLIGLDKAYLLGKLVPSADLIMYDNEATVRDLRRHILTMRREWQVTDSVARELWDETIDLDSFLSADEFLRACRDCEALTVHIQDIYEFCRTRRHPRYDRFWETVWLPFTATLKKELEDER